MNNPWQHRTQQTQDEDKQNNNKKHTTQKTQNMSNIDPTENRQWTQMLTKG